MRTQMRGVERIWVGIRHSPARIRHETPPILPPPFLLPRLPDQQERPDTPGADPHPRPALIWREHLSAHITIKSTPFRETLVLRSPPHPTPAPRSRADLAA